MDEKNVNAKGPLVFNRREILCALLLYPAAYIYTLAKGGPRGQLWFGLSTLLAHPLAVSLALLHLY